jgi:peptidoglycan/LPS O-acetylase OafA/YrhL
MGGPARRAARERPQPVGHQDGLDGLRFVASCAVVIYHVGGFTGDTLYDTPQAWLLARGEIGVALFFVLSGLLLFRPWVKTLILGAPSPAVPSYLWRRALRILPAFWLVTLVSMFAFNAGGPKTQWDWSEVFLLLHIYDFHPWWPAEAVGPKGLGQMWSLGVEMSFYVLLPLIAMVLLWFARRGGSGVDQRARRLLIGLGVLACTSFVYLYFTFYPTLRPTMQMWLPRYLCWFLGGMALCTLTVWAQAATPGGLRIRRFCQTIAHSPGTCVIAAGVAYAVAATPIAGPRGLGLATLGQMEVRLFLYGAVAVLLVAPVAFQPQGRTVTNLIFGNPVMRFLGRISYGVFLWQFAALYWFYDLTGYKLFSGGFFVVAPAGLAFSIALSAVTYYAIEKPSQALRGVFDDPVHPAGPLDTVPQDRALLAAQRKDTDTAHPDHTPAEDPGPA